MITLIPFTLCIYTCGKRNKEIQIKKWQNKNKRRFLKTIDIDCKYEQAPTTQTKVSYICRIFSRIYIASFMFILMCNSFDFILHIIQLKCTNYKHCFRIPANIMLLWIKTNFSFKFINSRILNCRYYILDMYTIPFERNSTLDDVCLQFELNKVDVTRTNI